MISFNSNTFYLETKNTSYVFRVLENGMLHQLYYGKKINQDNLDYLNLFVHRGFSPPLRVGDSVASANTIPQEYPTYGRGDFRLPAIEITDTDGRNVCELKYKRHNIIKGKPEFKGLPQLIADEKSAETLEIELFDDVLGLSVKLLYSVFENEDIIVRRTVAENKSDNVIKINKLASMSIDILNRGDLEMLELQGGWAKERSPEKVKLHHGITSIDSRRGSSGHQLNPFVALTSPNVSEDYGDVYATVLVYSGNFSISVEKDEFNTLRFQAGINPHAFCWNLKSNESFTSPEVILTYTDKGLCKMSQNLHNACRNYLGKVRKEQHRRTIVLNNWEATYFDFNEEKIVSLIEKCKGLGIDTFVLDDGWFGERDTDVGSLGDWYPSNRKLPNGFKPLVDACKQNGMNFGLWFEPEMICQKSELYKAHPDWCIHTKNREPIKCRNQYILDLSRDEVVDAVYNMLAKILRENDISYIKWDMNRNMTDNGSDTLSPQAQGEHSHRYILGVYDLMNRLVTEFPNVLFEGCSGGGGRFDLGCLYYMPQTWTSDDSDAIERLNIQYGTSYVYPPSVMTAHVSACPNHQTGRMTSFKTRGNVAMLFGFGYELDITKLSDDEIEMIKAQTATHNRLEELIETGDFYRLENPFESNICAWEMVSCNKKHAYTVFTRKLSVPSETGYILKFKGLEPETIYTVKEKNLKLSGITLMNAGIPILPPLEDFWSCTFELQAE